MLANPQDSDSPTTPVTCWRCELTVYTSETHCPRCLAPLEILESSGSQGKFGHRQFNPMKALLWSYALLLITGVLHSLILFERTRGYDTIDDTLRLQVLMQIFIVEVIDTVIVGMVLVLCRSSPPQVNEAPAYLWKTTAVSIPTLAALLLLNFGYHSLLHEVLQVPLLQDEVANKLDLLLIVTYCLQPAIVEELYFRGFSIGVLRGIVGRNGVVWISAVMFAFLHTSVLLSIPYLILVGAFFGYVRVLSGSLILPMLLHFAHNLIVLGWELL